MALCPHLRLYIVVGRFNSENMKLLETITEIKEKLNRGEKLNCIETDVLMEVVRKYEYGISQTTDKIKEIENEYNPHLHGSQYQSYLSNLVINIKEVLGYFS